MPVRRRAAATWPSMERLARVFASRFRGSARAANHRILETECAGQGTVLASPAFERIAHPSVDADGRRTPALRFGDPRIMALAGALCTTLLAAAGTTNESLRALMTGLLRAPQPPARSPTTCAGSASPGSSAGSSTPTEVPRGFRTVHPLGWTSGKVKLLSRPKKSFSPEFKDEAVKMVIETSRPIARVAKEFGINEATLGNWVDIYRRDHAGEEPPPSVSDQARLREVERENRELKMENDFLKKPQRTLPKIIGERQVRVHRRGVRGLPGIGRAVRAVDRENVHLNGGVTFRLLRVAG